MTKVRLTFSDGSVVNNCIIYREDENKVLKFLPSKAFEKMIDNGFERFFYTNGFLYGYVKYNDYFEWWFE